MMIIMDFGLSQGFRETNDSEYVHVCDMLCSWIQNFSRIHFPHTCTLTYPTLANPSVILTKVQSQTMSPDEYVFKTVSFSRAVRCIVLHCAAFCCSVLQCVAVC